MDKQRSRMVLLFTRFPVPGQSKTRLVPALGPEKAAQVQRELTECIAGRLKAGVVAGHFHLVICHAGASTRQMRAWLGSWAEYEPQTDGDLGQRMARAIQRRFARGADRVVVLGADCPAADAAVVDQAFRALDERPVVFGPAVDGGYYLVGLRQPCPGLFQGIRWGSDTVLQDSLARARSLGLQTALLPPLPDVDRPADLQHWDGVRRRSESLAVILPTLNEAAYLAETLAHVMRGQPQEIVVADGGSTDDTVAVARRAGATVLSVPRGRARQMNAAAAAVQSELLLFLHADTLLPENYIDIVRRTLRSPAVAAGAFQFALRESIAERRGIEALVRLRCRFWGLPFGDQGLFVRRDLFQALGGFMDRPLLEDVDLVRRLRRWGRIVIRPEAAPTSARRWQQLGVLRTFLLNHVIMLGYYAGVSPTRLAAWYRRSRHPIEAGPGLQPQAGARRR